MMRTMKMQTKFRRAEKAIVAVECVIVFLSVIAVLCGLKAIINGSLMAVVLVPLCALVGCMTGEDLSRVIKEAKRRDGNG